MNNRGLRTRGRFRIESAGQEAGIDNKREGIISEGVSTMGFRIDAILRIIISEWVRPWSDPATTR